MKHVLVLNHFAAPLGAPGGTRHVQLFGALRGWEARVIAGDRNYLTRLKSGPDGIYTTVWTIPYAGNGPARALNWLSYLLTATLRGLRGPRPDIVYASSPHLFAGMAGYVLSRLRRAAFVLEIRDLWPVILAEMGTLSERSLMYRCLAAIESFLYRRADTIVCLSEGVHEHLIARGVPASRVHVVPNGADPEDLACSEDRTRLRGKYGLEGLVFAYTGAHGPANGLDQLLDAAGELRDASPEVGFLLVGDGPSKQDLMRRAEREGLTNVRFLPAVPKNEIPALLRAVDVGVHVLAPVSLFTYGVSPNKIFDYMAAGLPVITNTPGEVARIVDGSGAGLAVGPDELAIAVRKMAGIGAEQRMAFGTAGRSFVLAHHSRAMLAGRLEEILEGVAAA